MIVIPAIDIQNGKCVRLLQGDFAKETVYSEDPIAIAKKFEQQGAKMLHVVDLDGARTGKNSNIAIIKKLVQSVSIPVEVGGGIRDEKTIQTLLSYGAKQIVIGTLALENEKLFEKIITTYKDKIILATESKNNKLMTNGWTKKTNRGIFSFVKELKNKGVSQFLFTDITKDGTMQKPNFSTIKKIIKIAPKVIISGGVSSIEDIKKLKILGVQTVIIGKALYEKRFTIKEANNAC